MVNVCAQTLAALYISSTMLRIYLHHSTPGKRRSARLTTIQEAKSAMSARTDDNLAEPAGLPANGANLLEKAFPGLMLGLPLPRLQLDGGNVIISLSDRPEDQLFLHSQVLGEQSHRFRVRFTRGKSFFGCRDVTSPETGDVVEIFEYHLAQKKSTDCLTDEVRHHEASLHSPRPTLLQQRQAHSPEQMNTHSTMHNLRARWWRDGGMAFYASDLAVGVLKTDTLGTL